MRSQDFRLVIKIIFGKLFRLLFRPKLPEAENNTLNLHLGCGDINHPKFINIDAIPRPHVHYVRAIDDLSLFEDNSVDLIYACHCLEHFPHEQVKRVLSEWFRALKENGILRISVPDFDLLLDIYNQNGKDVESIIYLLMGGQNYKFNYHKTVFNKRSLSKMLKDVGFKYIQEWTPSSCELTTFNDWSSRQYSFRNKEYPVSLNIEGIK